MKLKVNDLIRFKKSKYSDSYLAYSFIKEGLYGIIKEIKTYHYIVDIFEDTEANYKFWNFTKEHINEKTIEIISENKTIIYLMNKKRK